MSHKKTLNSAGLRSQTPGAGACVVTSALPPAEQVENFFCMGSPLAVFLALRGIRPGILGTQDHILPKSICQRLFNIFHPTDPVVRAE